MLKTTAGNLPTALDAGPYTLVVQDSNNRYGFRLAGRDFEMHTGKQFVGR